MKMTQEEYKDLVMRIAVEISPLIIEKKTDSISAAEHIAIYAEEIAEAVDLVFKRNLS